MATASNAEAVTAMASASGGCPLASDAAVSAALPEAMIANMPSRSSISSVSVTPVPAASAVAAEPYVLVRVWVRVGVRVRVRVRVIVRVKGER